MKCLGNAHSLLINNENTDKDQIDHSLPVSTIQVLQATRLSVAREHPWLRDSCQKIYNSLTSKRSIKNPSHSL